MPKLQFGDTYYRIIGDGGEEGELSAYGEAATLETLTGRLVAVVDVDPTDQDEVISLLPEGEWLVKASAVDCEHEDVDFEGLEDEELGLDGGNGPGISGGSGDEDEDDEEDDDELEIEEEPDEDEEEEEEEDEAEVHLRA